MQFSPKKETSVRFNSNLLNEIKKEMVNDETFPFDSDLLFVNIASYNFLKLWKGSKNKKLLKKQVAILAKEMRELGLLKPRTTSWKSDEKEVEKDLK